MSNKFCTVCAKYNECTWMQVKVLNGIITDCEYLIHPDDWMGTCCKYFVYDSTKGETHETI